MLKRTLTLAMLDPESPGNQVAKHDLVPTYFSARSSLLPRPLGCRLGTAGGATELRSTEWRGSSLEGSRSIKCGCFETLQSQDMLAGSLIAEVFDALKGIRRGSEKLSGGRDG